MLSASESVRSVLSFCQAAYGAPGPPMAIFQVHCDESGKLQDSKCVVFEACVFPEDEVAPFSRKWEELLRDANVGYVSMKEAMNFHGEFLGWKERPHDRDSFLETLAKLLMERHSFNISSPMDSDHFNRLPEQSKKKLKNPIYAGFETLMRGIVADAAKFTKSEHRFHLIYDLNEEYSVEVLRLFNRMRMQETAFRQFFPSLTFADDEQFPPLQGADMLAYCRHESFKMGGDNKCSGIVRKILEIRNSYGIPWGSEVVFRNGSGLGDGVVDRR